MAMCIFYTGCFNVNSQPEEDFTGGEFVLTQQIPRAQSKGSIKT